MADWLEIIWCIAHAYFRSFDAILGLASCISSDLMLSESCKMRILLLTSPMKNLPKDSEKFPEGEGGGWRGLVLRTRLQDKF